MTGFRRWCTPDGNCICFAESSIFDGLSALPEQSLERAFVAGRVVGHRFWRVFHANSRFVLSAAMSVNHWPPREPMQAVCGWAQPHVVPTVSCHCGIHALKRPADLKEIPIGIESMPGTVCVVSGTVALWGRVIEHEYGYRAEKAYPLTISPVKIPSLPAGHRILRDLQDLYGCGVEE